MGEIKSCSTISEYSVLHDLVYTYMISKSSWILLFLYFLHIVLWKRSLFEALRKFILRHALYIFFYCEYEDNLSKVTFGFWFWWAILAKTICWKITVKSYKHKTKSYIKNSIPYTMSTLEIHLWKIPFDSSNFLNLYLYVLSSTVLLV